MSQLNSVLPGFLPVQILSVHATLSLSQIRYCLSRHSQCKSGINSMFRVLGSLTEIGLCVSAQSELSCYC